MKKKKIKIVYPEDNGQTIYSMAALDGQTPEEKEEFERYRILLLDAIDKMERAEKLSVENLF